MYYIVKIRNIKKKVPPRLELGSLDSKSKVLTITPWDLTYYDSINKSIKAETRKFLGNFEKIAFATYGVLQC